MAVDHTWIWLDKNGALQQTFVEQGEISEYELENLTPSTGYRVTAGCVENGLQSTSNTMQFTTIAAGTITLTHSQTVRSGNNYIVTYTYTSTYAPSWSTLSTNGSTFQGVINSGQHTVTYTVTGLTAGEAYLTNVTLGDIYGETETVTGSIYATVVNSINIAYSGASETTVTMSLDYIVDSGFHAGFLEYWDVADDPSTDQPQGHTQFNDGDTTATITNLTAGTEYKFRATIELNDSGHSEIVSNVVTESTAAIDYSRMPFTVENIDREDGVFTFKHWTNLQTHYSYSLDDGTTWNSVTISSNDVSVRVPSGGKLKILGDNTGSGMSYTTDNHAAITFDKRFIVYGNIVSLFDKENYETLTVVSPSSAGTGKGTFGNFFKNNTTLISAENLSFGKQTRNGQGLQFANMFYGCTNMTSGPKSMGFTSISLYNGVFNGMFWGCTSLLKVPVFENIVRLSTEINETFKGMFTNCTSLIEGMDLSKVTYTNGYSNKAFVNMYKGCSSLSLVYAPDVTGSDDGQFVGWLTDVAASGTLHKRTLLNLPTSSADGVPSGWTVVNHLNY